MWRHWHRTYPHIFEVRIVSLRLWVVVFERLPAEACLLLKTGSEMERAASDIDEREAGFAPGLQAPVSTIQIIRPGLHQVGVQLPDGRVGYIAASLVENFRSAYTDAVVLL